MAEEKEVNIMSVEQAIQRELAYRKKIAYLLSEAEFAELLPLEVPSSSKVTNSEEVALLFLGQSMKSAVRAFPESNLSSSLTTAATKDVTSTTNVKQSPMPQVPSSSRVPFPEANATCTLGQKFIPTAGPGPASTLTSRPTMVAADESRPPIPNVKPPSFPSQNPTPFWGPNQNPSLVRSDMVMQPTPRSFNHLPNQHQKPHYTGAGPNIFCKICQISCSNLKNYKMHVKGHKHKATLRYMQTCGDGAVNEKKKEQPRCNLCRILCSDQASLDLHLTGQKHRAKLQETHLGKKQKTVPDFWCGLCQVPCNSEEVYKLHLKGKNHAAQLARKQQKSAMWENGVAFDKR